MEKQDRHIQWKPMVKRNLSLLFFDLINKGQRKENMRICLGVDFGYDNIRVVETLIAYDTKDCEEAEEKITNMYTQKGIVFFKNLLKKWNIFLEELEKNSQEIALQSYSKKSKQELLEEFENLEGSYTLAATTLNSPLALGVAAEKIIKKKLNETAPAEAEEYFIILTTPDKDTEGTKEFKSILKIAILQKKGKDCIQEIQKHIANFGWINTRGFYDNAWTPEDIQHRLDFIDHAEEKLNQLEEHTQDIQEKTEIILKKIHATNTFREFVAVTKEIILFRTKRMDILVKAGFLARPLFKEIAERVHLSMPDLFYLTTEEIKEALMHDLPVHKRIEERKKGFARIQTKDAVFVLVGKELEKYKQHECQEREKSTSPILKGNVACKGSVKGYTKVIKRKDDIVKIVKGDILVASMTTPDLIPAMEKAAAFVTDEGGIVCHAAIISREMNKPCIIGTKVATEILQDGDYVEVDAYKGIVRKIKE